MDLDELTRRRLLWTALAAAAGYFLLTVIFAATTGITAGWYLIGAAVYGGVFVIAIIGFIAERGPTPEPAPVYLAATPVAPVATSGNGHSASLVQERVIYTTPTGQVLDIVERDARGMRRDFRIETDGQAAGVAEVEEVIDARGWTAGREPSDEELHGGLRRWGRIRGGN
jgi:uncharacterized protein (DUF58 family)